MSEPACKNCLHSARPKEPRPGYVDCRYNPPVIISRDQRHPREAGWPEIAETDWCSKFTPTVRESERPGKAA